MKYVIRVQVLGFRHRHYFPTRDKAREFAREHGIPYSQIKKK